MDAPQVFQNRLAGKRKRAPSCGGGRDWSPHPPEINEAPDDMPKKAFAREGSPASPDRSALLEMKESSRNSGNVKCNSFYGCVYYIAHTIIGGL